MSEATKGNPLLLPLREVSGMLSMTRQTVMSFVHKGELTCVRLARNSVYFRYSDIIAFVDSHLENRNPIMIR